MTLTFMIYGTDIGEINATFAVPPSRSVFPDYGLYTDFFGETGPYLVRIVCEKSGFMLMLLRLGESSCSTSTQIGQ